MKKFVIATVAALVVSVGLSDTASAQQPAGYPFFPFGFYQPYGARFGATQSTPPYFALNPPVYYGARYARPYGMSPFAAPPMVSAPNGYTGRLRSQFHEGTRAPVAPACNPYIGHRSTASPVTKGIVQHNPFMETGHIAKK